MWPLLLALTPPVALLGLCLLSRWVEVEGARGPNSPLESELADLASFHGVRGLRFKTKPGFANAGAFGNRRGAVLIYDDSPRLTERAHYRWLLRHEIGHLKNGDTLGTCFRAAAASMVGAAVFLWSAEIAVVLAFAGAILGWQVAARRAERRADVFATEHTPPEELEEVAETFQAQCFTGSARAGNPRLSGMWRKLADCHPTLQERATLLREYLYRETPSS